ncbi:MAG: hypothetical protein OHK0024_34750 [Thalassobaculales bacterium]
MQCVVKSVDVHGRIAMLDEVRFADFLIGLIPGPVPIARAFGELATALNAQDGTFIWLSCYNYDKICYKHKDITLENYRSLQQYLEMGAIIASRNRTAEVISFGI